MVETDGSLEDKIVVVTGASGDIGRATTRQFLASGAIVVGLDRGDEALASLRRTLPEDARLRTIVADVTDEPSIVDAFAATQREFGGIDVLINNAGIEGVVSSIDTYPTEIFRSVLAINVTGVFLGMKHVIPIMRAGGGGSIVNLASTAGLKGAAGLSAYVASKHAVIGLTRTAAIEWGRHGIRINCVCPGPIDGRMIASIQFDPTVNSSASAREARERQIPSGRYGHPDEVAKVITFLASGVAPFVNGACYPVDGGISAM